MADSVGGTAKVREAMRCVQAFIEDKRHQRFLVTTHRRPDGDGVGSEMALYHGLRQLKKDVFVVNVDATPKKFGILNPDVIQVFDSKVALPDVDAVIVIDTNDLRTLGPMQPVVEALNKPVILFDHHVWESTPSVDSLLPMVDETMGSTGELIYRFFQFLKLPMDVSMATAIYVAMTTENRTFSFRGTSVSFHSVCAELLQLGVCSEAVHRHIYAQDSFSKVRLYGYVLERVETMASDRIAWLTITKEERDHYQATLEDTESFVNQLTLIEGVQIGIMFSEQNDGRIKVSLRGMECVPVLEIAQQFGGGGHRHAAGMKLSLSMEDAQEQVLEAASGLVSY